MGQQMTAVDSDHLDHQLTIALQNAADAPQLHAVCHDIAQVHGFAHYFYAVRLPVSLSDAYHFALSGYPRAWRTRYDALGYFRIDPVVAHAMASSIPLFWDEIARTTPEVETFFREASEHGLGHGVSAAIAGRHGDLALFSLARDAANPIDIDPAVRHRLRARLNWHATVLHEAVRRVVLTQEGAPRVTAPLSEREKDCLMWAADGKTTAEIARALDITERTVLFHIESAGRKLGVSGRHSVIARAVALGEIELHQHARRSVETVPVLHE
jgi:DNA-binding CsgD family transcriptional regulator